MYHKQAKPLDLVGMINWFKPDRQYDLQFENLLKLLMHATFFSLIDYHFDTLNLSSIQSLSILVISILLFS